MEKFANDFFEGEYREGFWVESKMKRAWAAEIEILMEIDRVCRKNNIQYFADSGTLLGAIRHKGFIPWDDDIDIAMKRQDYLKFIKIAERELSEEFKICNMYNKSGEEWALVKSIVVNGEVISFKKERLERFHGCPYMCGVDIFILDYLPSDDTDEKYVCGLIGMMWRVIELLQYSGGGQKEGVLEVIEFLKKQHNISLDLQKDPINQALRVIDKISMMYKDEESEELVSYADLVINGFHTRYKKEWYKESVLMPFENVMVPVPVGYDGILRSLYGDYMKPVREYINHDYPFYKEQDIIIKEWKNAEYNHSGI